MFWQESDSEREFRVPDDIVDVAFRIDCKVLPLDHARELSRALHEALPWLADEARAGIHLIHGAESGNGWVRPEDPETELLHLPRRTRMMLRLPRDRINDALGLAGQVLDIGGYRLAVGEGSVRLLPAASAVFARYVADEADRGEEVFLESVAAALARLGVPARKLLCGRSHVLRTPDGEVLTRSVMVADLKPEESVKLQQHGIGPYRKLGCGLFLPHKGIAPLTTAEGG